MSNNSLYSQNSEWLSSIKDFAEVVDKNLGSELDPSPNRKGSSVNEKVRGRFSFENRVDQSLKNLNGFDKLFAMTEAMVTYTMQIARMSGADEWETEELKDRLALAARKTLADPEKAPLPFIIPEMYEILHQKTVVEPVFNEVIALHQKMQESDRRVAEYRIKAYGEHRERLEKEHLALLAKLSKFDLKSDIEHREACDRENTELMEKVSARLMAIATANPGKSVEEAQAIADADPELIGLNQMLALVEARRHTGSPENEEARAAVRRLDAISSEIAQIDATIQGLAESMARLGAQAN